MRLRIALVMAALLCGCSTTPTYIIDPNYRIDLRNQKLLLSQNGKLTGYPIRVIDWEGGFFSIGPHIKDQEKCSLVMEAQILHALDFRRKYYCECYFEIKDGSTFQWCINATVAFENAVKQFIRADNPRAFEEALALQYLLNIRDFDGQLKLSIWDIDYHFKSPKSCQKAISTTPTPIVSYIDDNGSRITSFECNNSLETIVKEKWLNYK